MVSKFEITKDLEFSEVINEFPSLNSVLESLDILVSDLKKNESIASFFSRKNISNQEEKIILRKLNRELNYFLKNGIKRKINKIQTFSSEEE